MTIILCSNGYPGKFKKNQEIKNFNLKKKNLIIYHAGTKLLKNKLLSNGGRVLSVTGTGKTFKKIRLNIFSTLRKINWKNGFFRKDIGWRVINKK